VKICGCADVRIGLFTSAHPQIFTLKLVTWQADALTNPGKAFFIYLNRDFMKQLFFFSAALLLASACQKSTKESNTAGAVRVTVYLTDDQSLVFDKVFIDLQKLELKVEDDGVDSLGGWFTLNIRPGIYDILKFRNGLDTLFATGNIPANRKLQKLRLTLGNNNSVEKDGKTYPLLLKNNRAEVIAKLDDSNVDFIQPDQFQFWLDFDAGRSIRERRGQYELDSQIRIFTNKKTGRLEGKVLPQEAQAVVLAINGSDTISARPENNGNFKFIGLPAGTYQLLVDATANAYRDTLLTNLRVIGGNETKIGTVLLGK
jgi:hypothetical protein